MAVSSRRSIHDIVLSLVNPPHNNAENTISFDIEKSALLSTQLRELIEKDDPDIRPSTKSNLLRKTAELNSEPVSVKQVLKERVKLLASTKGEASIEPTKSASFRSEMNTPDRGQSLREKLVAYVESLATPKKEDV